MRFSVIIPVYNVEKYLPECIDSVLAQDFSDYEVILVNDGSTDNSGNICDEYGKKYSNIKVIHKENGGLSDSRNFGIKEAKGQYIWFFDADDIMEGGSLSKIMLLLKKQNIDLLSFGMREYYQDNGKEKIVNIANKPSNIIVNGVDYLSKYQIDYSSCIFIIRREVLIKNSLFFLKGVLSEDYEFHLRLYKYCNLITHTKDVFYNYIIRTGSLSRRANDDFFRFHHQSMIKILQNLYDFVEKINDFRYSKALVKHITKIKLIALGMLLKSVLPIKEKKEFYSKLQSLDVLSLQNSESVKKTFKQKIIVLLVNTKTYYFAMLLLSKIYNLKRI
ncbi:glycosyltransferase family 2 protein [Capnocytophaga canimorsus]